MSGRKKKERFRYYNANTGFAYEIHPTKGWKKVKATEQEQAKRLNNDTRTTS